MKTACSIREETLISAAEQLALKHFKDQKPESIIPVFLFTAIRSAAGMSKNRFCVISHLPLSSVSIFCKQKPSNELTVQMFSHLLHNVFLFLRDPQTKRTRFLSVLSQSPTVILDLIQQISDAIFSNNTTAEHSFVWSQILFLLTQEKQLQVRGRIHDGR